MVDGCSSCTAGHALCQRQGAAAGEARLWLLGGDKGGGSRYELYGQWRPLWEMVRQSAGKKARKGPRAIPVVLDDRGQVATSPGAIAEVWAAKFAADFSCTERVGEDSLPEEVADFCQLRRGATRVDAMTEAEWLRLVADALPSIQEGRATGRDGLPVEALTAGGLSAARRISEVCVAAAAHPPGREVIAGLVWQETHPVPELGGRRPQLPAHEPARGTRGLRRPPQP